MTPNGVYDPRFFAAWPSAPCATPAGARHQARTKARTDAALKSSAETRVLAGPVNSAGLPFETLASATTVSTGRASTPPASSPGYTSFVDEPTGAAPGSTTPVTGPPDFDETTAPALRMTGATLPFPKRMQANAVASHARITADDLSSLREQGGKPIAQAWEAAGETKMSRAIDPSKLGLPTAPAPAAAPTPLAVLGAPRSVTPSTPSPPPSSPSTPPLVQRTSANPAAVGGWPVAGATRESSASSPSFSAVSPPIAPTPFASTPAPPPAPAPSSPSTPMTAAASVAMSDVDRVQTILKEIWAGDRSQAEVLASHGLSEVDWRALRRKARP
jgi:hypothetical protein